MRKNLLKLNFFSEQKGVRKIFVYTVAENCGKLRKIDKNSIFFLIKKDLENICIYSCGKLRKMAEKFIQTQFFF